MSPFLQMPASRRRFMKQLAAVGAVAALPVRELLAAPAESAASSTSTPLAKNAFDPLPLGAVKPAGWLRGQLELQASGLSGHLDETWADVGPESGWLGGKGESWERGPYFLDGLIPLAYLLDDAGLKAKAQKYIDWTLGSQQANGIFGPVSNDDWWPRMVMLKALTQYAEATGDKRVQPLMERYFAYQMAELPKRPLRDWGKFRWQDNALSVLWLYHRNGDAKLLELVKLLHAQGFDWVGNFDKFQWKDRITSEFIKLEQGEGLKDLALATHGVNNGQAIKTGAVWSRVSGAEVDRANVRQAMKVLDEFHGLPNGMFSCDEHLAGRNQAQGSELCTVVEYMFSLEQSLSVLGDADLGDRLELLAFNALPGTISDDMWTHQYNQEPNQVECSLHRKPWTTDGPESNLFGLEPNFGCCTANFHQGWPKFAASLWMASEDGLALTAYGPSEVKTAVRGVPVHVVEETEYPFRGTVKLTVKPESAVGFPLMLRVPGWAKGTSIKVNGQVQPEVAAGSFAKIARTWKAGDRVEISFPMEPRITKGFLDAVTVERGPLVYSLGIGEGWLKLRDRGMTADWQIYPTTQWNYGLIVDEPGARAIEVNESPVGAKPFSSTGAPVKLKVKARKLPGWRAEDGVADLVPQSPVVSGEPVEAVTLVPYAAAKLRITAFPQLKS